jgi:ankyrin repeat protein
VEFLLKYNVDTNVLRHDHSTPLFIAAYLGHFEIVKNLIDSNADINQSNQYGFTPLSIASIHEYANISDLLRRELKKINEKKENNTNNKRYR